MSKLLLRHAEIDGESLCDVRIEAGHVTAIEPSLATAPNETEIDAAGGALLPGLHDHHLHLFALAAAKASAGCGPPDVVDAQALKRVFAEAAVHGGWVRAVGYHESVAGDLDCAGLDALTPEGVCVRMQHRSGAMWLLNSTALKALALEGGELPGGVERDGEGKLTGRIYYEDTWLRSKLGTSVVPDLAGVGKLLASYGVTGVTDATPDKGAEELAALAAAVARQDLRQRVVAMGRFDASPELGADISMGAVKIMLREPELPDFDALVAVIEQAHRAARGVAFHCVTRAELVTAAAALREAGTIKGDRIEHASVAPPELVELLAELSVTVVTQPGFIYERGDVYAKDVVPADRDWLYRGRGFLDNGVALGAGTDAPYGDADPWLAIRAAVTRTTREARVLGRDEGLSPERALALFTSPAADPGGLAPRVCVGMPADLCLVDLPWHQFRERLMSAHVRLTVCRGDVTWQRDDHR